MGEMRILCSEGDLKVVWTEDVEAEIEAARKQFNDLKKKGYKAYYVKDKGRKGDLMERFDAEAQKMILVPAIMGG